MKHILSTSKMRERIPLDPKKKKGKFATFTKGDVTELSDADFDYLNNKDNSMLPFLLKEGTFKIIEGDEVPEKKPSKLEVAYEKLLKKKEGKGLKPAEEEKLKDLKSEIEKAKERQGK